MPGVKNRGFASMDKSRQKEIASRGGKAAHRTGKAHEFSSQEAKEAGRKGGEATAKTHGESFYSAIGKKGGESRDKKSQGPADEGGE